MANDADSKETFKVRLQPGAQKIRITWNGQGGELDSVTVKFTDDGKGDNDMALTRALIRMLNGNIVQPGDSFTVEEVKARGQ